MDFKHTCHLDENYIKDFYLKVGKNVARIRKEKNLTQLELSYLLGYKSTSLVAGSEICYKNYHFNLEHLAKIAYSLDVNINEFFKDIEN